MEKIIIKGKKMTWNEIFKQFTTSCKEQVKDMWIGIKGVFKDTMVDLYNLLKNFINNIFNICKTPLTLIYYSLKMLVLAIISKIF